VGSEYEINNVAWGKRLTHWGSGHDVGSRLEPRCLGSQVRHVCSGLNRCGGGCRGRNHRGRYGHRRHYSRSSHRRLLDFGSGRGGHERLQYIRLAGVLYIACNSNDNQLIE